MKRTYGKLMGLAAATGMSLVALSGVAGAQAYPPQGEATPGADTAGQGAGLAFTGSDSADLALLGIAAVAGGGALTAVARRRRSASTV